MARRVEVSKQFERDLKRISAGVHGPNARLLTDLHAVLNVLCSGGALEPKYCDHPLAGEFKGYRDCHVRNDLVLIYKLEPDVLKLARLGTHSDLF